ncbi:calcium-transporting P-type ATPase, PMR1-type [[Eubacterium] cellulosolvens]
MTEQAWHAMTIYETFKRLDSSKKGLDDTAIQKRLKEYGPNELQAAVKISPVRLLIEQFKEFLIVILIGATLVSLLVGEIVDAIVIFIIVILSAVLGFIQEYRAEKALEALKRMAAPTATVLRKGEEKKIAARGIVPGDILIINVGDRIAADARLFEGANLKMNEAPLTGESISVEKNIDSLSPTVSLPDRINMVFTGTTAVYGRGKAIVTSTGMRTEFGKIAALVQTAETAKTPLEIRLEKTGKWLGGISLSVCALVAGMGILQGRDLLEMLIWGISLAVAAVPEALPAIVTGGLAIGVQKMAKRNAIVRRLPSVETLGAVTVICSDKTGTLTKGEMTVRKIFVNGHEYKVSGIGYNPEGEFTVNDKPLQRQDQHLDLLLKVGALCNDSSLTQENGLWKVTGDPTEGALIVAAEKRNIHISELKRIHRRIDEVPFTSERKMMTTIHQTSRGKRLVCVKGAVEVILNKSKYVVSKDKVKMLTREAINRFTVKNQEMASDALRVLAFAYKEIPTSRGKADKDVEKDLILLGLTGIIDPPREEAKLSVRSCQGAGITPIMITGDHKITASVIAQELGILEKDEIVLTGEELESLNDSEFEKIVEKTAVYARVSPEHKLRIVKALQEKGHVVAMTGDGVNDAPALKNADIGVSMGITGTDVTKESSSMILADDNFATIVSAVEEGRRIYDNIKKYIAFLLSANVGEIIIMLIAGLLAWPLPLLAIQILWVNLVTDGLPAMALGIDPPDPDLMKRPPRDPKKGVFTRPIHLLIIGVSLIMSVGILPVFHFTLQTKGLTYAQTMAFTMIVMYEMFNAFNCRSEKNSIFAAGPLKNRWLISAIASSIFLQLAVLYVPPLPEIFKVTSLGLGDWIIIVSLSTTVLITVEIGKYVAAKLRQV